MSTEVATAAGPAEATRLDYEIAIIGGGLSGLGMAAALKRSGICDFVILERADDIGGTWRDNTYPGVGVDIPTFAYQFSYQMKSDWSRVFAKGAEVKSYIDDFAEQQGIRSRVRFNSEVLARTWDEEERMWRLRLADEEVTARFVISAIGPFVDPKPVDIPGVDEFAGKVIHSARWDHDYDLRGKRVAVIGTGASAVQLVPEIATEVSSLAVYQRTPIWVFPKPDPKLSSRLQRLFRRVPGTERLALFGASGLAELILVFLVLNARRAPFAARLVEAANRRWMASCVDDPEVLAKLTPKYGLGCKRPSVSNRYLRAFNRANVELVTDGIEQITPTGIRTSDGLERDADVLVLATGFRLASDPQNYVRTPVRGRDGLDLATLYETERLKAYEGISMPGLPNHFIIFGPYGWTGGSWHVLVETASSHIARVITETRRRGASVAEVKQEPTERFFEFVSKRMEKSLWFGGDCTGSRSYYIDHHGDAPFLRPTSSLQAYHASRTFPLDDYSYS